MNVVAQLCGHKSINSGAWLSKLAALRAYNLVEGRGSVRVTDIGKRITYPKNDTEKNQAIFESLTSIPLWKELFSKYGVKLPTSNFWADLATVASISSPEAQKAEKWVQNAYLDDFRHYTQENKQESEGSTTQPDTKVDLTTTISEGTLGRFSVKGIGQIDIMDADTYEIAKSYFKVLAKKLGIQEEQK